MSFLQGDNTRTRLRCIIGVALLVIALVDVGSHAVCVSHSEEARVPAWCDLAHYASPGIDCPHQRERRGLNQAFSDDLSHQAVVIDNLHVGSVRTFRDLTPFVSPNPEAISRPPNPPLQPPKQV